MPKESPQTVAAKRQEKRAAGRGEPRYRRILTALETEEISRFNYRPISCVPIDIQSLKVSYSANSFAVRMLGNTMEDAHILDGDIVLFEEREPRENDIVAALVNGLFVIRRFVLVDGRPFFRSENRVCLELLPQDIREPQGVMVALMRSVG